MTRTFDAAQETWEFPFRLRGVPHAAAVTHERGSAFLDVEVSDACGDYRAHLVPTAAPGSSLPDGYVVAVALADEGHHALVGQVVPKESPASADSPAQRVRLLEADSNWELRGGTQVRHESGINADGHSHDGLGVGGERIVAAAKAARLHAVIGLARQSFRSRAEVAAASRTDPQSQAALARIDAEVSEILQASRLSLDTLTV